MPLTNENTDNLLQRELERRQKARQAALGLQGPTFNATLKAPTAMPTVAGQGGATTAANATNAAQNANAAAGAPQVTNATNTANVGDEAAIRQSYADKRNATNERYTALEKQINDTYAEAGKQNAAVDYGTWLQKMGESSEEEQARRQKRARNSAIIAGVGDVLASIANVLATTRGAKNTYKAGTLSAAAQARADKIREEGERLRAAYRKYRYASDEAERSAAATNMRERLRDIMKLYDSRAREENNLQRAMNSDIDNYRKRQVQKSQIEKNEQSMRLAEEKNRREEAYNEARIRKMNAAKSGKGSGKSGGSGGGKYEFLGQHYATVTAYNQAVLAGARRCGVKTRIEGLLGNEKDRRIAEIAAEVAEKAAEARGGRGAVKPADERAAAKPQAAKKPAATKPAQKGTTKKAEKKAQEEGGKLNNDVLKNFTLN